MRSSGAVFTLVLASTQRQTKPIMDWQSDVLRYAVKGDDEILNQASLREAKGFIYLELTGSLLWIC